MVSKTLELLREQVREQEERLAEIKETNELKQKLKDNEKALKREQRGETEKALEKVALQGLGMFKKAVKDLHERNEKEAKKNASQKQEEDSIW